MKQQTQTNKTPNRFLSWVRRRKWWILLFLLVAGGFIYFMGGEESQGTGFATATISRGEFTSIIIPRLKRAMCYWK